MTTVDCIYSFFAALFELLTHYRSSIADDVIQTGTGKGKGKGKGKKRNISGGMYIQKSMLDYGYNPYGHLWHTSYSDYESVVVERLDICLSPTFMAGDNVFARVCLFVCLSVTKISQEPVDIFQFPFTGKVPHTRGRTD